MSSDRSSRRFRVAAFVIGGFTILASLVAGCSSSEVRKLPITYVPQQNVQAIAGAQEVPVEVTVEDLEPGEYVSGWDQVGAVLFGPFSERIARFHAEDAVDTVRGAAETELKARGFKTGNGGALVIIQIERFEAQSEPNKFGFAATGRGYLSMRVEVQPQSGKVLFSKNVDVEGIPTNESAFGKPATHVLQESLADAFDQLFADPAFTAAILATRQTSPAKPVSPVRISGAFAIMSRR